MALKANPRFDIDQSYSYLGKDKIFEGDTFESEIGDVKSDGQFFPQLKIKRWDNEANFSVRLKDAKHIEPTVDGEKIIYDTPEYRACFYYLDGGFEFEVLEHVKRSRTLEFTLRHKGLKFHYQGELTQEEIDEGHERPEDIIGSYAVKHATKANHIKGQTNYKSGKAFHIERPWVEDANGWRVWADLHIDPDNNLMKITIPQDFFDNAVWPVLWDPTFGYTTIGASSEWGLTSRAVGHENAAEHYTASSGDTVTDFHIYSRNTSGTTTCQMAVYDMNTGNDMDASSRLAAGVTITLTSSTAQWWTTGSLSQSLTASRNYSTAVGSISAASGVRLYYDSQTPGYSRDTAGGGALPATWTTAAETGRVYSFYTTYSAGGGAFTLTADSGSYTVTGTAADVLLGAVVSADSGSYTYSGTDVDLNRGYPLGAGSGTYTYTGTDAALTFAGAGAFTLNADSGTYTYTGTDAALKAGYVIGADSGSYTYTGTDADLKAGFYLAADTGTYTYTGTDADLSRIYVLEGDSGTYTYLGSDAILSATGQVWTIQGNTATTWVLQTDSSDTWTEQADSSDTWTIQ